MGLSLKGGQQFIGDRESGLAIGACKPESQAVRTVQPETPITLLDQPDDARGIDAVLACEFHDAGRRADFEPPDTEIRRPQLEPVHAKHRLGGRWQRPESVNHFHLQIIESAAISGTCHALVKLQAQVHVRHVVFR
jgi:hypothetical protein